MLLCVLKYVYCERKVSGGQVVMKSRGPGISHGYCDRKLRSSSAFLLKQNKWNLKSYGFRTFTVAAPFLWNSLPLEVKSSPSLNIFKSKLKTHLFKCAFNLN